MLAGARPLADPSDLDERLIDAARQALATGEVVRLDGQVLVCPDTLVLEVLANGEPLSPTSSVAWSDDAGDLAGRRCLLFRLAA